MSARNTLEAKRARRQARETGRRWYRVGGVDATQRGRQTPRLSDPLRVLMLRQARVLLGVPE